MLVLLFIPACIPYVCTSAAAVFTFKAPLLVTLDDQADKLPDSNPSAKIRSGSDVGVGVGVSVGSGVLVGVEVGVSVGVGV
jgi:hypothetical protein